MSASKVSVRDPQVRAEHHVDEKPPEKPSRWTRLLRSPCHFPRYMVKGLGVVFRAGFKMVGVFVTFIFFLCKLWFGLLMSIMLLFFLAFVYFVLIR